jgi:hypothetical protein
VRLLVTGLGLYRREQIPTWVQELDDDELMAAQALFWRSVAARNAGEPGIFAYDLQNEPFVVSADTDELVTPPFAPCDPDGDGPLPPVGFSFVHQHFGHAAARFTAFMHDRYGTEAALAAAWPDYPAPGEVFDALSRPTFGSSAERIADDIDFRHASAALWAADMAAAVRSVDDSHLVTVGLTSGSLPFQTASAVDRNELFIYSSYSPAVMGPSVDFVSVHLYPRDAEEVQHAELVLRAAGADKPVIIEETLPIVSGDVEAQFFDVIARSSAGALSFYWGGTQDELRTSLEGIVVAGWLDRFIAMGDVHRSGLSPVDGDGRLDVPLRDHVMSAEMRAATFARFVEETADGAPPEVALASP